MRYPAEETAEKHRAILEKASVLFRERGFDAVTVSEVMKATGLTHGAFYNHFESKDALIAETLGDVSEKTLDVMQAATASPETMREYIADYLSDYRRDDAGDGCLMTALAADVARMPAVKPVFTRHLKGVLDNLMAPFSKVRKRNARRDAIEKISTMVGAIVLARAVDDPALSDEILAGVRELMTT